MSFSKNRSLIFIITGLLITNILVLSYFLWFKKPHTPIENEGKDHKGIAMILQNEVGFNEQQIAQYRELKEKQWATIKPMLNNMCRAKDSLFRLLSDENASDSVINQTADVIARQQKAIEIEVFNHFKKIRSLCTPAQRPKYDSLAQRLIKKKGPCHEEEGKRDKK